MVATFEIELHDLLVQSEVGLADGAVLVNRHVPGRARAGGKIDGNPHTLGGFWQFTEIAVMGVCLSPFTATLA